MNERYLPFIIGSYALTAVVLLWNLLGPRLRRNQVRRQLSESLDQSSADSED